MLTTEDRETLRLLVQHVSRAFYEPKYTIIMDQLARHTVLKDDDLASRMGLQPKELNKIIATLSNDRLVQIYRQNELREGAQRATSKQYYYIDYEHFCNVVKWRIARMRKQIDTKARNELDNKGYICPQCKASYTPLEVDKLMDMTLNALICEICHAEVIDNEEAECVLGNKDRMQRFNHQMRFIRAGLQKSEDMTMPAFDVATWVKAHQPDTEKQAEATPGAGLKIAGSDGVKFEDVGIGVLISTDKDEATRRRERDEQAQAKRQQNTLPEWHRVSTVSGQLTALGTEQQAREAAKEAEMMQAGAGGSSNDDILRGLGIIGMKNGKDQKPSITFTPQVDVKPVINAESQYYDHYYASLQNSAQPTPTLSMPGSSDFDDIEEEDRKPQPEYLDSLNEYKKRSRSREEMVTPNKTPKLEEPEPVILTNGHIDVEMEVEPLPEAPKDDPIVYVNGNPMPFSQVTEAEHDLMTPEEYTAYFQVAQEQEM
ncbi:HTH TFE/IIEalpha-type domain-containing protein [Mycena indigotica]|uniref:HTH TFE/IIEalpha-type domain-containing protein n=1 Tax=Mycena indigotica TaxID=2126181 RepID=A0A8H6TFR4_9AGAR|nr:HTH TFE/IIEalpha-type domain-containing protein [Mycena indigotica]KAF7316536.1 HTH TFE/IIEalpha-type domain-containing protein [Mycena indigotica]